MEAMKRGLMCLLAVLSVAHYSAHGARLVRDVNEFKQTIDNFARDYLGIDQFQGYLDSSQDVSYEESPFDGPSLVSRISDSLSAKFVERSDAVRRLRDSVRDNWNSYGTQRNFDECCNVRPSETDAGFKTEVDFQNLCVFGEGYNQNPEKLATSSLLTAMRQNSQQYPSIKYQYLGTEEGVIFNYPSAQICLPKYDPRFRPWYVETTTLAPKDVVIVIDHSGSMTTNSHGRTLMDIAIEAGTTVVDTLNPNDRVGVVAFSTNAATPSGTSELGSCFSSQLAMATPANSKYLRDYIETLRADGGTYYTNALNSAFTLFEGTPEIALTDFRKRDRVILFLTDGQPNDDEVDILETLRDRNARVNNTVSIITFGLGSSLSAKATSILEKMAQQEYTTTEVKRENLIHVSNPTNLRFQMASYYTSFVRPSSGSDVTITVPYYDAFGLGLITSICLPVLRSGEHKGVVCADISMADLLSDVSYFTPGQLSYAFIMDKQSRLLLHPYLPAPLDVLTDPIFVTMPVLENAPEAAVVMESMLSGGSGNSTFASRRIISRGSTDQEGIDVSNQLSQYIWQPIMHTSLSLCVVIGDGDKQAHITWTGSLPTSLAYHRFELQDDISTCNYFGKASLSDQSSLKFSPDAFEDAYTYIEEEETKELVNRYIGYLTGRISVNPGFVAGIRETVAATNQFDSLSRSRDDNAQDVAVWTYLGMNNGVFRLIPGNTLHKLYDHIRRPWYQRALANKNSNTFSTPYEDAFGAGKVITLSKAVFEGRRSGAHDFNDVVVGVMGLDFTVDYFYVLLVEHFPSCEQATPGCLVVDSAGLVVMHTDWYNGGEVTENTHIISKEPSIALNLITSQPQVMTQSSCVNYESSRTQRYWRLSASRTISNVLYDLHPVTGSNIFIIIKKTLGSSSEPRCSCSPPGSSLPRCQSASSSCECPCQSATEFYRHCLNVYDVSEDTPPPCTPRESPYIVPAVESDAAQLDLCFPEVDCQSYDKLACYSTKMCSYSGSTCETNPDYTGSDGSNDGGINIVAVVVPVVPVVVIIAGVVGYVIYKRNQSPASSSSSPSAPPQVHENPAMSHETPHDHSPPFNPHYSNVDPPPPYSH